MPGPWWKKHQLQDQVILLEGDFLNMELASDFDVALISGVVLIKPESDCRKLFGLAYDLLNPAGLVIRPGLYADRPRS